MNKPVIYSGSTEGARFHPRRRPGPGPYAPAMQQRELFEDLARALRSPVVPEVFETLEQTGYLASVWPQLKPSVETAGFLSSALYMADMALEAVLETYEPQLS